MTVIVGVSPGLVSVLCVAQCFSLAETMVLHFLQSLRLV